MFDGFLQYIQLEKRYSLHTVEAYQTDLHQFADFLSIDSEKELIKITSRDIRSWLVSLVESKLTNRSVNRKLASLRTYFKYLQKEGEISESPMKRINGPKNEKRLPIFAKESELAPEKIAPLFTEDFDGKRDALMVELFYQTGIRLSELINLTTNNVSTDHIKVLGKRNKERLIPISNKLSQQINSFLNTRDTQQITSNFLLTLENGRKMYPQFVYRKINAYLSQATTLDKTSPHVLRHTFATHMLNRGTGLETLKDLLGHANLSATQVYTHNSFAQLTSIYSQAHPRGHKS